MAKHIDAKYHHKMTENYLNVLSPVTFPSMDMEKMQ